MNFGHIDTIIAFAAVMAGVSLVITALTQAVSALLGLRGLNLKWSLENLVRTLAPDLKAHADPLVRGILQHPLLSASSFSGLKKGVSSWRYATHVRQEELFRLLDKWASALAMPQSSDTEKAARRSAIDALGVPEALHQLTANELAKLQGLKNDLKDWFDAGMDRASQRFTANTRLVTVGGAFVVSVLFLFDSIEVWNRLSADPELRARVIASSDALLKKADEMAATGSTHPPAMVYLRAAEQFLARHTNELGQLPAPAGISNLASGLGWLTNQFTAHQITNGSRLLEEYQALVPQAALRQAADDLNGVLEKQLVLSIIYSPYPTSPGEWCRVVWERRLGLLVSVALLSLGAPFWFNLLRQMSNLRPVLANKEAAEQAQRAKASAAAK